SQGVLDFSRGDRAVVLNVGEFGWNSHCLASFAHKLEIGALREPGASPVRIPLVVHEPTGGHEVQHRRNDISTEARRRVWAPFGESPFELWPQAGHHE